MSFDPPLPCHYFMHGAGKYGLQCMTNLDLLPPTGAVIVCPPLKIEEAPVAHSEFLLSLQAEAVTRDPDKPTPRHMYLLSSCWLATNK